MLVVVDGTSKRLGRQLIHPENGVDAVVGDEAVATAAGGFNLPALFAQLGNALPHGGAADAQFLTDFFAGDIIAAGEDWKNVVHRFHLLKRGAFVGTYGFAGAGRDAPARCAAPRDGCELHGNEVRQVERRHHGGRRRDPGGCVRARRAGGGNPLPGERAGVRGQAV